MSVLVVAALSARMLAEAAHEEGFDVIALDLFGDADTRRACTQWRSIGDVAAMRIDGPRFLAALREIARGRDAIGWIVGSGFEGEPEWLARGDALLPLLGNAADVVRRVRDPQVFFDVLDAHGIAHPPVRFAPPAERRGWLLKDARGCGGQHIVRAVDSELMPAHHYFQRELPGKPMSATFLANGREARVLGFNAQIVREAGDRPFVFCGVIGPVPMPRSAAETVTAAVDTLVRAFDLRGLGSLDFLLDGDDARVLEINPRPPASLALYGASASLITAHIRACRHGELSIAPAPQPTQVAGIEIVYAHHALSWGEGDLARLAKRTDCHDLPAAATRFAPGEPVCSVSARGASAAQVRTLLAHARDAAHRQPETSP
jgi:uncharacterized protein